MILSIRINPHMLRSVFTEKCTTAGIHEKYIDAFCGRIQEQVIRKHYSDYSPEKLRLEYALFPNYEFLPNSVIVKNI